MPIEDKSKRSSWDLLYVSMSQIFVNRMYVLNIKVIKLKPTHRLNELNVLTCEQLKKTKFEAYRKTGTRNPLFCLRRTSYFCFVFQALDQWERKRVEDTEQQTQTTPLRSLVRRFSSLVWSSPPLLSKIINVL